MTMSYYDAMGYSSFLEELPKNDVTIFVEDLTMSTRLANILRHNGIYELSRLSRYPYSKIMKFRNMGPKTYEELKELCDKYQVTLLPPDSALSIPDNMKESGLPMSFLIQCARSGRSTPESLNGINTFTIFQMCRGDYQLTMRVYRCLKKLGVTFGVWEDSYLFESLSARCSLRLWESLHITTVVQLFSTNLTTIAGVRGIGKKGLDEIKDFMDSFSPAP